MNPNPLSHINAILDDNLGEDTLAWIQDGFADYLNSGTDETSLGDALGLSTHPPIRKAYRQYHRNRILNHVRDLMDPDASRSRHSIAVEIMDRHTRLARGRPRCEIDRLIIEAQGYDALGWSISSFIRALSIGSVPH